MDKFEFKWTAPEFEYRDKDVSWYWISIIVAVFLLGLAVWQKNFPFGFFIIVAEVLLIIWGSRQPNKVEFSLTEKGLRINSRKFYSYLEIDSFSVSDHQHTRHQDLIFSLHHHWRPALRIILPKEHVEDAEKILQSVLVQKPYEPSLVDALERFLRF